MTDYPVHPKAAAFRLMHDYEFEALVDGIRDNGLLVPITLATWVDEETGEIIEGIIDGRNRQKACEEAQVKPLYQTFRGSGEDGIATEEEIANYIEQIHNNRRNLSLDQQAMALAILYPSGGRAVPGNVDPAKTDLNFKSVEQKENASGFVQRIGFARTIRQYRPDRVQGVVYGDEKPLSTIAAEIRKAKKEEDTRIAAITELREAAPDLARDVEEQTLDLKAAQQQLKQRQEEAAGLKAFKREHPELAEIIDNEELTLDEAEEFLAKRIAEEAKQEKYDEDLERLREINPELAKRVDAGELSLEDAIEQHDDAIKAAEALEWRLRNIHEDLADAVRNGEMTIEAAEKESKKRTIEANRNKPPDLGPIIMKWEERVIRSSVDGRLVSEEIEKYEKNLDQLRPETADYIVMYAMMAHEHWLKVVNLLRGQTDQKRHFNVIGGEDK